MLKIQYVLPSPLTEAALSPASDFFPGQPRRRRLRLYLVGSRKDTQSAIDSLQALGYAERFLWSRVVTLPENGLVIHPDPGNVLRYLQRELKP